VFVGVIVGIVALVAACCWFGCCGCCGKKRAGRVVGRRERERIAKQGTELMEQGGGDVSVLVAVEPGRDEMEAERARVNEEVVRDYIDPPPGYKP